jgi:aminoglycoside phosphotransferase (APT) family kinase protein
MTELPGLDLARLTGWLDANHPGLRCGPLTGRLIAGGRSNLSYRVADDRTIWALRRPPLGHVLPTAHDMSREYRVIGALRATAVPVPGAVALCEDANVLGAPFYLMDFVDGPVLDSTTAVAAVPPTHATRTGELLIDTLLALHELDPAAVGLGGFGHPDGYLRRQLSRWHSQWLGSETRPVADLPLVVAGLTAGLPTQSTPGIVHGDYRTGNVIYAPGFDHIAAVIDWEMATVGDPLADLGLLLVYHRLAGDERFRLVALPAASGFLTPDQLADRYRRHTTRDLTDLDWYIAFSYFKLAVISETIRRRHLAGQTVGAGFDEVTDSVPLLLQAALRSLTARE